MARPRDLPYVHVTYLSKLIAGEAHCEWAAWFKSQNYYTKRPGSSSYQGSEHEVKHTKMLNKQRVELEDDGYTVTIERQNDFIWQGRAAKLAGKPDLIGVSGDECLIVDVKTGSPVASHEVQLLIYMWAAPKQLKQCADKKVRGLLVYEGDHVFIELAKLTTTLINDVSALIRRLADPQDAAKRVPSARECRYCQISDEDCSDRYVEELIPLDDFAPVNNDFF